MKLDEFSGGVNGRGPAKAGLDPAATRKGREMATARDNAPTDDQEALDLAANLPELNSRKSKINVGSTSGIITLLQPNT